MRTQLLILTLVSVSFTMATEPPQEAAEKMPPAVTVTGQVTSFQENKIDGKTTTVFTLKLNDDSTILVSTPQTAKVITDALNGAAERRRGELKKSIEQNNKRNADNLDLFIKAIEAKDKKTADALSEETKAIQKEGATMNKEMAALGRPLGMAAVAEGSLEFKDKAWRLAGTVRPWEPEGKDRAIGCNVVQINGNAVKGEFKAGKEVSAMAIRTGGTVIVVTGKLAKEGDKMDGPVQAYGKLELGKDGSVILDASKLEALKK